MIPDINKRALNILFGKYWSRTGWKDERARSISHVDFNFAKQAGVMFDEVQLSHDEIMKRVAKSVRAVDRRSVANAFVVSLSLHRLDLRSALGSFAVLQHFPRHAATSDKGNCSVCGAYSGPAESEDLNVLNFERLKWGGVRHLQPLYASFDIELFKQLPCVVPTPKDVKVLKMVLKAIDAAPASTTSAAIEKHFGKIFKSNKSERDIVVGILGFCGILETTEHPGFMNRFVMWKERKLPARHWIDMAYPACWWRRLEGINRQAVEYWFGHLL